MAECIENFISCTYILRETGINDDCQKLLFHRFYWFLQCIQKYREEGVVGDVVWFVQVMEDVDGSKSMGGLSQEGVLQHAIQGTSHLEVIRLGEGSVEGSSEGLEGLLFLAEKSEQCG